MAVKTNGAEFLRFWLSDLWSQGAWVEDEHIRVNGEKWDGSDDTDAIQPTDNVEIVTGLVYLCQEDYETQKYKNLARVFSTWLKAQSTIKVVVTIDPSYRKALDWFVKECGGKIR